MGHKGPGNVPWRSTRHRPIRTFLMSAHGAWFSPEPSPSSPCCAQDPNDACTPEAASAWLQFADFYQWPHLEYYDTPEELVVTVDILLRNATLRNLISAAQRRFFAIEMERTEGHVRAGLRRVLDAAQAQKSANAGHMQG